MKAGCGRCLLPVPRAVCRTRPCRVAACPLWERYTPHAKALLFPQRWFRGHLLIPPTKNLLIFVFFVTYPVN